MAGIGGGGRRRQRTGTLESGSGWAGPGGALEAYSQGPPGGWGGGGYGGGGGGYGLPSMEDAYEAMLARNEEALRGQRQKRQFAAEEQAWRRKSERKKWAPKMESAKKAGPMDPMRYINQARQAARHAQGSRGGYTGIGQLALKHEGEAAARQAAEMYPLYAQAMMAG